jgi:hypothetical protein
MSGIKDKSVTWKDFVSKIQHFLVIQCYTYNNFANIYIVGFIFYLVFTVHWEQDEHGSAARGITFDP